VIAAMQADYARATGIAGLKVRHNGTLGYVVEVTAAQAERLRGALRRASIIARARLGARFGTGGSCRRPRRG
jgi:DNA mismatch repair protein MutS